VSYTTQRLTTHLCSGLLLGLNLGNPAFATENGGSSYPMGTESWVVGALPPPGLYSQTYLTHYSADELKDNNGNTLPIDFKVDVNCIAERVIWVTGKELLGGNLVFHTIVPLVDVDVSVNGMSDSKQGLGDIFVGAGLGFHHSDKLHTIAALDMIAPTGRYDADDLANPGRNYWALEAVYAATYIDPEGFNGDIKLMYDYNFENDDTDYRSGQEFHFDYALGWAVTPKLVAGVGGYYYRQVTDDELNGHSLDRTRGQAFAIGPALKYSGDNWFLNAKWQQESQVKNRAEGDAFWLKLTVPF